MHIPTGKIEDRPSQGLGNLAGRRGVTVQGPHAGLDRADRDPQKEPHNEQSRHAGPRAAGRERRTGKVCVHVVAG